MPSKDPEVNKRNNKRYRESAKGKARRNATKKVWARTKNGQKSIKASDKAWRQTAAYKAGQAAAARAHKQRRKKWLDEYKAGLSCVRCGYNKCIAALHFHHVEGEIKVDTITKLVRTRRTNMERVLEEIAKCEVLCANCHAELHYNEPSER